MARRPSSLTQTVDISSKNYLKSIPLGYFQWTSWLKSPKTGVCETEKVATRLPKPNLQIFCKIRFIMGLCITTKAIFRIFMKNSFPKSCLINAPKCGQESSNEHPSIPKNPISLGGWFAANIAVETAKIEFQAKIEQLQTPDNSVEQAIDKVLNFSQNSFAIFKSSQIEEKRRILNIVFANFLMDGKNPEISMHKNFKLLSKIGACEDWCPGEDSNFHYLR